MAVSGTTSIDTDQKIFVGKGEQPAWLTLALANRHGLVTGATGTGKTVSLQVMAEGFARAGVPVFAADIKGDLSGISEVGVPADFIVKRATELGLTFQPDQFTTVFWDVFGEQGHPVRATVTEMGPLLLSRMLDLNDVQEGVLNVAFRVADDNGLTLIDMKDLRALLDAIAPPDGPKKASDGNEDPLAPIRQAARTFGNVTRATVGTIQRQLLVLENQGGNQFFGEPALALQDFMRTDRDGRGVINILAADRLLHSPRLYATFLLWMLSELFEVLPEVGDLPKPKLVFFFDEAHLLFSGASADFLEQIVRTVRLIRSKGVGIFFVTQTPKDVPNDVLAQLGSRIQHQLRAHTPDDAKALRATVSTYPTSDYDLGEVLTSLATGEAIVTVMNEKGAPTPVAWTRLRAPEGSMDPMPAAEMTARVQASPLLPTYGTRLDPDSAYEMLARRMEAAAADAAAADAEKAAATAAAEAEKEAARAAAAAAKEAAAKEKTEARERAAAQKEYERAQREFERAERAADARRSGRTSSRTTTSRKADDPLSDLLGSGLGRTIAKEVVQGIFSTLRRRR